MTHGDVHVGLRHLDRLQTEGGELLHDLLDGTLGDLGDGDLLLGLLRRPGAVVPGRPDRNTGDDTQHQKYRQGDHYGARARPAFGVGAAMPCRGLLGGPGGCCLT